MEEGVAGYADAEFQSGDGGVGGKGGRVGDVGAGEVGRGDEWCFREGKMIVCKWNVGFGEGMFGFCDFSN